MISRKVENVNGVFYGSFLHDIIKVNVGERFICYGLVVDGKSDTFS